MNVVHLESTLQQLKRFIVHTFFKVVATLLALLLGILYLTSLVSSTNTFSDTSINLMISVLYVLLIVTLSLLAWSFYLYQDQESDVEIVGYYDDQNDVEAVVTIENVKEEVVVKPKVQVYQRRYRGFDFVESQPTQKVAGFLVQQHPKVTQSILAMVSLERAVLLTSFFDIAYLSALKKCEEGGGTQMTLEALDKSLQEELHPLNEARSYLNSLEKREIQTLLLQINKKELTYALMGFDQEFQERILATMSPNIATTFREVLLAVDSKAYRKIDNGIATLFLLAKQLREDAKMRATNQPTG